MTKPDFENYPSPKYPAVWVIWTDSIFWHSGWEPIESVKAKSAGLATVPHDTLGHLIELDEEMETVTVALSVRRDGSAAQVITIPLVAVHSIEKLVLVPNDDSYVLWPKKKEKKKQGPGG